MKRVQVFGYVLSDESVHYTPEDVLVADVEWHEDGGFPISVVYQTLRSNVGQTDEIDPLLMFDEVLGWWFSPKREPVENSNWFNVVPDIEKQRFSDIRFEVVEVQVNVDQVPSSLTLEAPVL